MPRLGRSMTLSFPPFAGFVRQLIFANVIVYFAMLLIRAVSAPAYVWLFNLFALIPAFVMHGYIWQIVTYAFLHGGLLHILFNMLTIWFVGSYLEGSLGARWLREIFFFSVIGAAFSSIAMAYAGMLHLDPLTPSIGASGGIFGMLVAFAMLFGDQEFFMFPLPISIKAKYLVGIYILLALAGLFGQQAGTSIAHLGGALFGYLYVKFAPRRGFALVGSEKAFGLRNSYYRWKRKRASRKFEVYMRKQTGDKDFSLPDEKGVKSPNDKRWMN
jgi:membrane associated rhomboid family serine protease